MAAVPRAYNVPSPCKAGGWCLRLWRLKLLELVKRRRWWLMKSLFGSNDESVKRISVRKIRIAHIEIVDCVLVNIWFEFVLFKIGDSVVFNEGEFCCWSSGKKTKKKPIVFLCTYDIFVVFKKWIVFM